MVFTTIEIKMPEEVCWYYQDCSSAKLAKFEQIHITFKKFEYYFWLSWEIQENFQHFQKFE